MGESVLLTDNLNDGCVTSCPNTVRHCPNNNNNCWSTLKVDRLHFTSKLLRWCNRANGITMTRQKWFCLFKGSMISSRVRNRASGVKAFVYPGPCLFSLEELLVEAFRQSCYDVSRHQSPLTNHPEALWNRIPAISVSTAVIAHSLVSICMLWCQRELRF